jgi:hypothetical protein
MSNLTVTSTTNSILVDFGDTPLGNIANGVWRKASIFSFRLTSDRVVVIAADGAFEVADTAAAGVLVVDSIDAAAPASLDDLYARLAALIA